MGIGTASWFIVVHYWYFELPLNVSVRCLFQGPPRTGFTGELGGNQVDQYALKKQPFEKQISNVELYKQPVFKGK